MSFERFVREDERGFAVTARPELAGASAVQLFARSTKKEGPGGSLFMTEDELRWLVQVGGPAALSEFARGRGETLADQVNEANEVLAERIVRGANAAVRGQATKAAPAVQETLESAATAASGSSSPGAGAGRG